MNEWAVGYQAALRDIETLAAQPGEPRSVKELVADLRQDSLVIDHELTNREQKRRMAAAREATLPLFKGEALPLFEGEL